MLDKTDDEVREVAKKANCLSFIEKNEFDEVTEKDLNVGSGFKRIVGARGG